MFGKKNSSGFNYLLITIASKWHVLTLDMYWLWTFLLHTMFLIIYASCHFLFGLNTILRKPKHSTMSNVYLLRIKEPYKNKIKWFRHVQSSVQLHTWPAGVSQSSVDRWTGCRVNCVLTVGPGSTFPTCCISDTHAIMLDT